jgi:hypothetical protein
MRKKSWTLGMIIPLAATGVIASAPAASADPDHNTVTRSDNCNGGRDRLTLSGRVTGDHDRIRLTVRLRTTDNRADDGWRVTIRRQNGGNLIFRDNNVQEAEFDDVGNRQVFERTRFANNRDGADRFVARAVNLRNGQDCDVRIVVRGHNNNN